MPCWTPTQQPLGSESSSGYPRLKLQLKLKLLYLKRNFFIQVLDAKVIKVQILNSNFPFFLIIELGFSHWEELIMVRCLFILAGKLYNVVSFASQDPDATVFVSSSSESKIGMHLHVLFFIFFLFLYLFFSKKKCTSTTHLLYHVLHLSGLNGSQRKLCFIL